MIIDSIWTARCWFLWKRRRLMFRATIVSLIAGFSIAFLVPKQYTSTASIMPPDQGSAGALMLAALAGHSSGLSSLGNLASGLIGIHSNTPVFVGLLRSGTVKEALIERFDLLRVYGVRYHRDAARRLARKTSIVDDKRTGMITVSVEDRDPVRARDITQAYLEELNKLVVRTSTSQAHQERIFIERRLTEVTSDLEKAQLALSDFSSRNSTVDIKEQTRAMVDAGARAEGELLVEQSSLQSLKQIYGDSNVRVRQAEARIASLRGDLQRMAGSTDTPAGDTSTLLAPPLRQLPRLGVPYADLYRRVRVQESVFELLTEQYEMARIAEARDVPAVSIVDVPGIPEKKSFPPRLWLGLSLTLLGIAATALFLFAQQRWNATDSTDRRKALVLEMLHSIRRQPETVA